MLVVIAIGICLFATTGMAGNGATPPVCDIKINGGDSGVIVSFSNNIKIDFDIQANDWVGYPVDVIIIIKPAWGTWYFHNGTSFNIGPTAYFTGPLANMSDTVFDSGAVPRGVYDAYIFIDKAQNGLPDPLQIIAQDQCDVEVKFPTALDEDFEDGVADGWVIGPTPGSVAWRVDPSQNLVGQSLYFDNLMDPVYDWHSNFFMCEQYTDVTLEATLSRISGSHHYHYGMILRSDGLAARSNGYVCYLKESLSRFSFDVYVGGFQTTLATSNPFFTNADVVKVEASGSTFKCYFNGNLEFTVIDVNFPTGYAGLMGQGSATLDNIFEYDNVSASFD